MIRFKHTNHAEFREWPKIPRLNRDVTVTEKIDGTNACVWISDDLEEIGAQSRNKWITPQDDNAGFARWVRDQADELIKLGPGYHYGEWWGQSIGRKYGLSEKRFWLFNTHRWSDPATRPSIVGCVPILWQGNYKDLDLWAILDKLRAEGSVAQPGWMKPEGVVIFHHAADQMFKVLLEGDELPKGITTLKERQTTEKLEGK